MPRETPPVRQLLAVAAVESALLLALTAPAFAASDFDKPCRPCHFDDAEKDAPLIGWDEYERSAHADVGCVACHADIEDPQMEHEDESQDLLPVDCGSGGCHEDQAAEYKKSVHGLNREKEGEESEAATCTNCHGVHNIFLKTDPASLTFPLNLAKTCGECHDDAEKAARHEILLPDAYQKYIAGVHWSGLYKSGLLSSATCNDCHGTHDIQPHTHPASKLHKDNVVSTCGSCHVLVEERFRRSVHGRPWDEDDGEEKERPVCTSCHSTHGVTTPQGSGFRHDLVRECGTCHAKLMATYDQTFHGKATILGDNTVATCSDCHDDSHLILAVDDPKSNVNPRNKLATCRRCHTNATSGFAQIWAHPDPHDRDKFPILYYTYMAMMLLMVSVFGAFGLHTLLWGLRDLIDAIRRRGHKQKHKQKPAAEVDPQARPFKRFTRAQRVSHAVMMSSFLALAVTGAPLKYAETEWAGVIFSLLGGVQTAGWLHRVAALVTIAYFLVHVAFLIRTYRRRRSENETVREIVFGPDSMAPRWEDAKDIVAHMRWFLGRGPKPTWDRWTYWEKFDYWAVFWGIAMIGTSGLFLWFPALFSTFLPGWFVNVALVIHSDEALMAIGFIFAVHFFNGHLRHEKFPLDQVIFTGVVSDADFREERGRHYARLAESGKLEELRDDPADPALVRSARFVGVLAWMTGIVVLMLIIRACIG